MSGSDLFEWCTRWALTHNTNSCLEVTFDGEEEEEEAAAEEEQQ